LGGYVDYAFLVNVFEEFYMKKEIWYVLLSISGVFFLYLFVRSIIRVTKIFDDPNGFNLFPVVWSVLLLMALLFHVGGYVMVMDKKQFVQKIEDDDEWWTRWDRV
jgi:hypothetical protein